ncbi:MAG: beta-ketoacyl synthase N-terminal-like domain-containing protein [Planctomycetota bacterium]
MMAERIVISGVGPVSAIGIGWEHFANAVRDGLCGIGDVTAFDVDGCRNQQAGEIIELDVDGYLATEKNYLDRNSELAFAAAKLAFDDAGFHPSEAATDRFGLCLGTAYGNVDTQRSFYDLLIEKGPKFVSPFLFPHTYSNTSASLLAIEYSIRGVHANFCSGSAAGAEAILYAFDSLRLGRADVMLAGGAESLSEVVFKGLDSAGDERIPGEGAALMLLEPERSAKARSAPIRGIIAGAGAGGSVDAAKGLALADAGILEKRIDVEFGPDQAIDRMVGHTTGASGALAVAGALAVIDKGCFALVNTCEPGGVCVSIVLERD